MAFWRMNITFYCSSAMAVRKTILLLSLLHCSACSWDYHRSHYETPFHNPQPGEFYAKADSLTTKSHGTCERSRYFIKDGDWLHMSSCYCSDGWKADSAFDRKGRLYLVNKSYFGQRAGALYDSSYTFYFDRRQRPLKRYTSVSTADTNYEYWQYYDAKGNLEKEQRPIIYYLENE